MRIDGAGHGSRTSPRRLARLQRSSQGWSPSDYAKFLEGLGFARREGSRHTIYYEPEHPDNFVVVPRHQHLKPYIAQQVLRAIDTMAERREEEQ